MKKILFVFERLQVNGASKSLVALLNAICEDYDVSLFLFSHDGEMIRELPPNVKVLPEIAEYKVLSQQMKIAVAESLKRGKIGLAWFRFRVFLQRAMRKSFSQWKKLPEIQGNWDVVCSYADGFISAVVTKKVAQGKKILWVHENYEDNSKPQETLEAFYTADAVVGVSKDAIRHVENIIGESIRGKTHVVHNIVDAEEVRAAAKWETVRLPGPNRNIISVGRVSHEKGYDMIPAIVEFLAKAGVDVDWSIIGPGLKAVEDALMEDARCRGVDTRIHFLGEKTNPHPYTKVADCFVQLSRHEGWCMTITEALDLDVPVVVSDIPVFHEQVVEGENGFFANDSESFARAIQKVLCGGFVVKNTPRKDMLCLPDNVKREFSSMISAICGS